MKKTTLAFSLLSSLYCSFASAASMQDLTGNYEIYTSFMGVDFQGNFNVESDGKIQIMASSSYIYLNCTGTSKLINNILVSTPVCENGMALSFNLNLQKVSDYSNFQAPVYNNILNIELPMQFKRL